MESQPYLLQWSDSLSVGIPEIDNEHQAFIATVNDLNSALLARATQDEINHIMVRMLDDAEQHFKHEQYLFKRYNYPDVDEHARLHVELKKQLRDIAGRFSHTNFDREWISLGLMIKQLLVTHLLEEDMKYKEFFTGMTLQ